MSGFDLVEKEKLPAAASFTCAKCAHAMPVATQAQAVNIGCPGCGYVWQRQGVQWVSLKGLAQEKLIPSIPLGSRGRIHDVLYQVVGYVLYEEQSSPYRWREYVLFSPLHGYAFLSEFDGHWTYSTFLADLSLKKTIASSITYKGEEYKLFHRYDSKVKYAEGEFSWKLLESVSNYREYIAPPYMLMQEMSSDESCWLKGEYLEPEQVQEAFGVSAPMPEQIGVGAIEPFAKGFSFGRVAKMGGIAAAMLLVLHVLFMISIKPEKLANQVYSLTSSANDSAVPGPSFTLNSATGSSNLEFELYAPLQNEWLSLGITLINTTTNKAYDFELGTEYYSGYTGGENWSEGSTTNNVALSAMPDGKYTMILQPYKARFSNVNTYQLQVKRDVPLWSNFWLLLAFISVVPLVQWIRHHSFEKSRWMNSDFLPYMS